MNKAILLGRLTKDPELRYTSTNNTAVCNFTIAVNRRFSKPGEEKQADFIPVVVWDKLAEFCGKYFAKGRQVAVVGRIQTRTWDDNEGKRHYVTEVVAEEAYFADSKPDNSGMPGMPRTNESASPAFEGGAASGRDDGFYQTEEDDELPF
ncbi:MAG TPA: single-stranded DNA-binding protein [Clostridiales bacterium]|nr:single-stranded DNA-binding protein [Clostridiales bacterium]